MLGHPSVRHGAVLFLDEPPDRARIIAVAETDLAPEDIRAYLSRQLPPVMVPAEVDVVSAIPLTVNGKVDRAALRVHYDSASRGHGSMPEPLCRPVSASERLVAGQWGLLLGLDPDRLHTNQSLFAVGGDSLVASRVLAAVERLAGVRVSLSDFYATPTVRWTAEAIDAAHASGGTVENIGSSYATTGDHGALTSTSRSIWLAEQLSATSAHNVGAVVDITGPLAVAVLERSIDAVVRRHVALRSSVERTDDGPTRVLREVSTLVDVVDAADVADSLHERLLVERWAHAEAGRRLDLTQPPHLRISVLTLSSDRHRLVLCAHHAVVDNWALGLVIRELSAAYGAELTRAPVDPPAVTIDSFAYAAWQRDRAAADAFRDVTYWVRRLDGYGGRLDLPVDRQRPPLRDDAGALLRFSIPADVGAGISGLALANNATPFTVMLAALHATMHQIAAVDDIVVGVPVANRDEPAGVETVVDCLVETLATRASVDSGSRFVDHLRAVRDAWVEDFAHRHAPFDRVVESLDLPRDLSTTPLVQLMLVLQNGPTSELDLVGTTCASTMADVGTARYDLTYMLWPRDGGFDGVVEYATGLFDASTVESFVAVFCKVLEQIVRDPSLTLGAIDVTDKHRRRSLIMSLADGSPRTSQRTAISSGAQTHPSQTAVRGDGISLTYRELDRRSDDVAIRLVAGGIGRGSIAAVASMPGLAQVVALLGVAKAGADVRRAGRARSSRPTAGGRGQRRRPLPDRLGVRVGAGRERGTVRRTVRCPHRPHGRLSPVKRPSRAGHFLVWPTPILCAWCIPRAAPARRKASRTVMRPSRSSPDGSPTAMTSRQRVESPCGLRCPTTPRIQRCSWRCVLVRRCVFPARRREAMRWPCCVGWTRSSSPTMSWCHRSAGPFSTSWTWQPGPTADHCRAFVMSRWLARCSTGMWWTVGCRHVRTSPCTIPTVPPSASWPRRTSCRRAAITAVGCPSGGPFPAARCSSWTTP